MLANLTFETHVRFDDEVDTGLLESVCQRPPGVHRQDDAKMWNRDRIAVNRVAGGIAARRGPVAHELMAVEVEIDPRVGAATFRTPEQFPVELAGAVEIVDRDGQVERFERHVVG